MEKRTKMFAAGAGAIAIAFATYLATGRVDCTPEELRRLKREGELALVQNNADDYRQAQRQLETLEKACEQQARPIPSTKPEAATP